MNDAVEDRVLTCMARLQACCPDPVTPRTRGNRARILRILQPYTISASSIDRWRKEKALMRAVYCPAVEAALEQLGY